VTLDELAGELADGNLRPAYLVAGEEALLRDDALALLRGAVLEGTADVFNFDRLEGQSATAASLRDAVRTLPMMAPRRLVLLREPEASRAAAGALAEAIAEAIADVEGVEPQAAVLVVVAAKVDRRARWVRAFGDDAVVNCDPPRGSRELVAFARREAKRQGVSFERGALELLAERTGPQLLMLRQEIAKASLLAGPGNPVARDHVASGSSDVAEESIWELTDAVGEGRSADALVSLTRLLHGGVPPPVLLGTLVAHFRKLLSLSTGGKVSGPAFVTRKLGVQASRFTPGRLLSCLDAIHDTDTALKGEGALRPEMALERLVIGLSS
jgi:DNA polymerase-3 subunit delta